MKAVVTSKEHPAGIDEQEYNAFVANLKKQTDEMMGTKLAGSTLTEYCVDGNKINGGKQKDECDSINDLVSVLKSQKIEAQPVNIAAAETPVNNIPAPPTEDALKNGTPGDQHYDDLPPVPDSPQ